MTLLLLLQARRYRMRWRMTLLLLLQARRYRMRWRMMLLLLLQARHILLRLLRQLFQMHLLCLQPVMMQL
jgi:hypothetical protein